MQFVRPNNYLVNSHIAFRINVFLLGNILMCSLYVFGRIPGMSHYMHILVSIDIHVISAVRHSVVMVILWDTNVHMLVSADIAVICAERCSRKGVGL
jgi:hypothetical protein